MNPQGILVSPGPGSAAMPSSHKQLGAALLPIVAVQMLTVCLIQSQLSRLQAFQLHQSSQSNAYASTLEAIAGMLAGRPEDSGISLQIVQELGPKLPVFGVCMGHQCIGQIFGGKIIRAPGGVMHGKTSLVYHNNTSLMKVSKHLAHWSCDLLPGITRAGSRKQAEVNVLPV